MCRVLAYLGQPVLLDDLLYKPDSSLIKQAYAPKMLPMLNLAGFGMAAWDPASSDPATPFVYKTPAIPVFDTNLKQLARKIRPNCLLAHVRGVIYSERAVISLENIHPFQFEGFRLAMAHNGDLARFAEMKYDLLQHIRPEIARQIKGTTDSEWMYALVMSQVEDPTGDLDAAEITQAVSKTLGILRQVRERKGISTSSSVNLFLSDGKNLVATRFTFDFGCYPERIHDSNLRFVSLWYTCGRQYGLQDGEWKMTGGIGSYDSVIIASEPLTRDVSTWLEVPEYSMLFVSGGSGKRKVVTIPLDV